jgi:hypothetical protein
VKRLTSRPRSPSAAPRPVAVYEPVVTSPHHIRDVIRPSSWYLTVGPAGTATTYVIDFGARNEGHAALKLYDVRNRSGTRYFSKLRVSGEWQASCQG